MGENMMERSAFTVSLRDGGEEESEGLKSEAEGVGESEARKDESCLFRRFFRGRSREASTCNCCARIAINDNGLRLINY